MANRINFPLRSPRTPSESKLCRDNFIQKILAEMPGAEDISQEVDLSKVKFNVGLGKTLTAEGVVFGRFLGIIEEPKDKKFEVQRASIKKYIAWTVDTYNQEVQKAAVRIELTFLSKKIRSLMDLWPGDIKFIPYKMFSWSLHFVIYRQQLTNFLFMDLLEKEMSTNALNAIKFKVDLNELLEFINEIDEAVSYDGDMCSNVVPQLRECQVALNLQGKWKNEMDGMRDLHFDLMSQFLTRAPGLFDLASGLCDKFRHVDSYAPIEGRYAINWHRTVGEQTSLKEELQLEAVRTQIKNLKYLIDLENYSNQRSLNMLYTTVEKYKIHYDELVEKYDADLEETENMVNKTRDLVKKTKDEYTFLQNNVIEMRKKVENMRALNEVEENSRLEAELEITLSKRKSKKGKKKST